MMNKGVIIWKRNEMGTNIMGMLMNLRKYDNNDELGNNNNLEKK